LIILCALQWPPASFGPESVFEMLNGRGAAKHNADDIKTRLVPAALCSPNVFTGGPHNPPLFVGINGFVRRTEFGAGTRLDLNKNERVTSAGDDVNFSSPGARAEIPRHYAIAFAL
jgi:hypothetical protein